jgi:hypothetical protein
LDGDGAVLGNGELATAVGTAVDEVPDLAVAALVEMSQNKLSFFVFEGGQI